jgi:hypothetical protein
MARLRTIDKAITELQTADPGCALTKNALRQMVISKRINSVMVGRKYLIDVDVLEEYLRNPLTVQNETVAVRGIRRVC